MSDLFETLTALNFLTLGIMQVNLPSALAIRKINFVEHSYARHNASELAFCTRYTNVSEMMICGLEISWASWRCSLFIV